MSNLTSVHVTLGVPDSGTGTVSTLDNTPTLLPSAAAALGQAVKASSVPVTIASDQGLTTKVTDGTNTAAVKAASTVPLATDPALVVSISPNSVNANGQATMANSAPVVIASNQSNLGVNLTQVAGSAIALGAAAKASSIPVTLATDQPNVFVQLADAANAAVVGGTGNASLSAQGNLFSLDTTGYESISISVTSAGTACTITYEGSNDNSTWTSISGISQAPTPPTLVSTSTATGNFIFPTFTRYVRARVSAYTSGTVTAYYALRSTPANVMSAVGIGSQGSVSLSSSATGGYSYKYISAGQATTVVKGSAGTLHSITFNGAATATNTTTLYDNASGSGTVIGIPSATAVTTPVTLIYDIAFANGLTIITGTANGADMTIAYK